MIASAVEARTAMVRERARLRQGPSVATDLLGELLPGTSLEILGESNGWRQVQTPDGMTGYVWGAHLSDEGAEPKPTDAPPPGNRGLLDEVRGLRDEVSALRAHPEPATAADLERLRDEVERLSSAQQDLARRLDAHASATTPVDPPADGTLGLTLVLLLVGIGIGWIMSRLLRGRRSYRQRDRLRL